MEQLFFRNTEDIAVWTIVEYVGLAIGQILGRCTTRLNTLSSAIVIRWYNNRIGGCEGF